MPKILYPQVIEEDPRELEKLEKHHRYTHLFQRVRMLRLLKSGECSNLPEAADALWATVGASARGGSPLTGRVVSKSCSKAGWTNVLARRSWLRPKPLKSSKRP
jgi:hypothetical protein